MKFKAKKSRSATFIKGKQKEIRYKIGGEEIPTVKEQPVKSLGRWYKSTLSDRSRGIEVQDMVEEGLKAIDRTALPGKFKCWCLQFGLYPRIAWPLMMYEVALTRVERIEQRCSVYIRKWLSLPKTLNSTAIFGRSGQLQLPITSIVEEYKAGKVRTVMTLRYSKDPTIRDDPPEVRTGRKWRAEEATNAAITNLEHADIVGAVQETREGLGVRSFKPFCMSSSKEKRDAVVKEIRKEEAERRYLHLVKCSHQGQCLRWEELVVPRKVTWKEIWAWEPARTAFLIKATYDVLPSPANLVRWKVADDDKCRCGEKGTVRHILSRCKLALDRFTWRHDQVLAVLVKALKDKIDQINQGKVPTVSKRAEVTFHKAGARKQVKPAAKSQVVDKRWKGQWELAADLESFLVFPLVGTTQRPDIVVWSQEIRCAIVLELTVPWEDNFVNAEIRKEERYETLMEECRAQSWNVEYYHLAVGARGFIERKLLNIFRHRFGFSAAELRMLKCALQQTVEKASLWIWLKRDDNAWLE